MTGQTIGLINSQQDPRMVWYTSNSPHYRSFQRQSYETYDPANSVIALKDNG